MSEAKEQAAIYTWFCMQYPKHKKSWSVSMNGINLPCNRVQAAKIINFMKSQGLQNGEADFKILVPRGSFHGLVIEHKAEEGKHTITNEQGEYLHYMNSQGYMAVSCKGIDAAQRTIRDYMSVPRESQA